MSEVAEALDAFFEREGPYPARGVLLDTLWALLEREGVVPDDPSLMEDDEIDAATTEIYRWAEARGHKVRI